MSKCVCMKESGRVSLDVLHLIVASQGTGVTQQHKKHRKTEGEWSWTSNLPDGEREREREREGH